jgi:plasmid stabilization system protein ParE
VRELVLLDSALEDFRAILDHIARESGSRAIGRGFVERIWAM